MPLTSLDLGEETSGTSEDTISVRHGKRAPKIFMGYPKMGALFHRLRLGVQVS